MSKFDGIFLASDWDGTLYVNKQLSEENIEAIKYFQKHGGVFTVCSGRYYKYLQDFTEILGINTYIICYNGAYIVNNSTGEVLYQGFCDEYLFSILDKIIEYKMPYTTINIYDDKNEIPHSYTLEEYTAQKDKLKALNIYKVLLFAESSETAEDAVAEVNKLDLKDYIAVRSWSTSLEIMKKANSKGMAIRRVGERLGAKLIVAVGDYENDIEMIKAADIGYAVGNAVNSLKDVADRITVSAEDSALAKIIYDIERNLI